MILVFGGTTEGRICVKVLDEAGKPFFYSTKGTEQKVDSLNGIRLTGAMTRDRMTAFVRENNIRAIVDAAHPFASHLHATIACVADECGITVLRYERTYCKPSQNDVLCSSYDDAVQKMCAAGIGRLLALTGVNTISQLKAFWQMPGKECILRILNRKESFDAAAREGFPATKLITYDENESTASLITRYDADAVITKESGDSGGFSEKEKAAAAAGIPLYVVKRPLLPDDFVTVTGPHGLRREIERRVQGFFALRTGFTTGSCATAAAKSALLALTGKIGKGRSVTEFVLPDGENMRMDTVVDVIGNGFAEAHAVKDAGDDPDIIHNHTICVRVEYADDREDKIMFFGGEGIGTVTLPGLGIDIGGPAINITPRKMIRANLSALSSKALNVIISVPDGAELAKKTFNPKIGIVGGISIIGTSGIVRPFSAEAFADAVKREMEVALAMGITHVVLNSGAKSEAYVRRQYPDLPPQAFVHYGNFIGRTLSDAAELHIGHITLGTMLGKAVKLAAGNLDTHSKNVLMDRDFLIRTAREAGCSSDAGEKIAGINLARELWHLLSEDDGRLFFHSIAVKCYECCRKAYPEGTLTLLLIDEEGTIRETIK